MISLHLRSILLCIFVSQCTSKTPIQRGFDTSNLHKRAYSHSDHVQCDHGKPDTFGGQESRFEPSRQYLPAQESKVEPSRQYLPQPGPVPPSSPPDIEAPAASFDQPKFVSVENTFVSPSLQNNYKSLFGQDKKDLIAPAAAQSPSNAVPAPRVSSDKKHSHDDENNLERLCNDAFHSFLCKPIKGPRKTPTGRLRPNAVIPPDVLSGLASFQDVARVKPDPPKPTTQRPFSQFPTTRYTPTTTTTKKYEPFIPEVPSPSNNNIQVLKPAAQTPGYFYEKPSVPFPSNQYQQTQRPTYPTPRPTTPRPAPTQGYSYDKPSIPFPSNTIQKYAQPSKHDCDKLHSHFLIPNPSNENPSFLRPQSPPTPKPTPKVYYTTRTYPPTPKHDCEKHNPPSPFLIPNPSNDNPSFLRPVTPTTPKPVPKTYYTKPTYPPPPKHDCDKNKPSSPFLIPNPSNNNPSFLIPNTIPSPKPTTTTFYSKPTFSSTNNYSPFRSATQPTAKPHDCQKHAFSFAPSTDSPKLPLPSNNIAKVSPYTPKPAPTYYQKPIYPSPSNDFFRTSPPQSTHDCKQHPTPFFSTTEKAKLPSASNNIAQIIAQPQQINAVTISPQKPTGYSYEKPAVPFPPPRPITQRPTPPPFTYQTTTSGGYNYEQPRIPFPSNNIAQIISQPSTTTTPKPCEHDKHNFPSGSATSQNILKPAAASDAYVYDKPNQPFNGYNYDKPSNPFLLPSPANNAPQVVASPANNGYTYDKPNKPFPQTNPSNNNQVVIGPPKSPSTYKPSGYSYEAPRVPFPTNINSKIIAPDDKPNYDAKPQTQVEVTVRPGYSYDRPSNSFSGESGYVYPEPSAPFIS
ncbi:uncharacterized protein LOC128987775 [Macrosteles quadrilineatus]|uniref:uncharacterized protein LOC128987775 n=1 Tax=Macrosteles quadrilineatus TaxID=74068 RepID=UPI0023E15572|nr:uncharacterized protein LOC128987775 [Macrosteles quadrilineatus]